jgi:lysophospholipase L1-like esterase
MRRLRFPLLLVLLAAAVWSLPAGAAAQRGLHYYVSLGDSVAAGTQPGRPYTDESYTDQLYASLRRTDPNLRHIKLGCPGERTGTMVVGNPSCRYQFGSQLDQAAVFLSAHWRSVRLISIDIGANDVLGCAPTFAPTCVGPAAAAVAANLPVILGTLNRATGGQVPIVGMNYYNPFLALWFTSPATALSTTQLVATLFNPLLESIYGAFGVRVADVETAFATTDFTPAGGIPLNVQRTCQWTWMCAAADIHPNVTGHSVIAQAFREVLG